MLTFQKNISIDEFCAKHENSRIFTFIAKNHKIIWMLQIKYVYLHQHPKVVELVDTPDLESGILIRMYGFESRL